MLKLNQNDIQTYKKWRMCGDESFFSAFSNYNSCFHTIFLIWNSQNHKNLFSFNFFSKYSGVFFSVTGKLVPLKTGPRKLVPWKLVPSENSSPENSSPVNSSPLWSRKNWDKEMLICNKYWRSFHCRSCKYHLTTIRQIKHLFLPSYIIPLRGDEFSGDEFSGDEFSEGTSFQGTSFLGTSLEGTTFPVADLFIKF